MAEAKTKQNNKKQVTAHARHLRIAPRKMRLVTNLIRGMFVLDALVQLRHLNKKGAPMAVKLLSSAIANAKNNSSLEENNLIIKSITTSPGRVMTRYAPRARGAAFVVRKRMSHVSVILEENRSGKAKTANLKFLKKAESREKDEKKEVKEKPKQTFADTEGAKKSSQAQGKRRLFSRKSGS